MSNRKKQYRTKYPVNRILSLILLLSLQGALHAQSNNSDEDDGDDYSDTSIVEYHSDSEFSGEYYFRPTADSTTQPRLMLHQLPDTTVAHYKKDADFWYADSSFARKRAEPQIQSETQSDHSNLWKIVGWFIVIAGFIAVLVAYLRASQVGFARKAKRLKDGDAELTLEEQLFDLDFNNAIRDAETKQDWRLAVRLHYLAMLRELSERNILRYDEHHTNADYVRQLRESRYYDGFFRLTREYEYAWYGKLDPGARGYPVIREHYAEFKKLLY